MTNKTSLRSRLIEWVLWRLRVKRQFQNVQGLRDRVIKGRPKNAAPPRSLYRRYQIEERMVRGSRIFVLSRKLSVPRKRVLYVHGGAYVLEIMGLQWKLIAKLIDRLDIAVTVPLYPLAPEHTATEVIEFILEIYRSMSMRASTTPVVLLGDSAGGGLAVAITQICRDQGLQLPESLVLLSPWLDVTCSDPSQEELEKVDPVLARPGLREEGGWYAGDLSVTDPRVSPLYGELHELPPMFVLTGTHDLLHADAVRLQKALKDDPQALQILTYPNMLHVWPSMPIPEAKQALDQIATFLNINR